MSTGKDDAWTLIVRGEGTEALEIDVYDTIGADFFGEGVTAKQVLNKLRSQPNAKRIVVRINSLGGIVDDAKAMVNLLRERAASGVSVEAHVDGLAASAAAYLTTAAERVVMPSNAMLMIHEVRGLARGTAKEMEGAGALFRLVNEQIASAFAEASARRGKKKTKADYLKMMAAGDRYFTADEAIEWGLADETTEAIKVAACAVDISDLANAPEALRSMPYVKLAPTALEQTYEVRLIDNVTEPAKQATAALQELAQNLTNLEALRQKENPVMTEQQTPKPNLEMRSASPAGKPTGSSVLEQLNVATEAQATSRVDDLLKLSFQLLSLTGAGSHAEAITTISGWRATVERSIELQERIKEFEARHQKSQLEAVIEKYSREGKLPPCAHEAARMNFRTAEQLDRFLAAMPAFPEGTITERTDMIMTLTAEEKRVCAVTGVSEDTYLAEKRFQYQQAQANRGGF